MNANVKTLFPDQDPIYDSIVDLVPGPNNPTPMVRLGERFNPHAGFELLVKLEGMNPFGSIKDRTAWFMLNGLKLDDGQSLVEPSAGNTGIALAALANAQGTPIEIAMPDGAPEEYFPKILDRDVIDEYISVTDDDAFAAGIKVARSDGVMVGPTTGALLHAASEWAVDNKGTAVVISGDNAAKYVSAYAEYL